MAAPSALTLYYPFKAKLGDGTIDLDSNTITVSLHTSSYTPSTAHSVTSDLTNEVGNGNGYTTGGYTLTGCTFTQTGGTAAFKSGVNPSWTGASAGFTARYAVFRAGTNLIGYMLLDSAPADVSFSVGNTVTISMNASGWFTLT